MTANALASLRRSLIAMSALAVVGDAMLVPFYPQFFAVRYGVTSPQHVGLYLAACCGVVVVALPAWARWLAGAPPLRLLAWTQGGAGVLSVLSAAAPTLVWFWLASLAMVALKASYLLIYPYLMSLQAEDRHANEIGTLAVVVHIGAIAGAAIGGLVVETGIVSAVFFLMAASDVAQMALCLRLEPVAGGAPRAVARPAETGVPASVSRLCVAMLVFYFGAFVTRPFFSLRWVEISGVSSPALSGLVYAMPAAIALLALSINRRRRVTVDGLDHGVGRVAAIGAVGLLLQALPSVPALLAGRCLFGWSLFQIVVALDALLFRASTTARYAIDFGKANLAQNLGVIGSSLAAGAIVAFGGALPFLAGAAAIALTPFALPSGTAAEPLSPIVKETVT